MLKQWLLKQLLLARSMDTTHEWRIAVHQVELFDLQTDAQREASAVETPAQASAIQLQAALLDVVDSVVPYLPEYSVIASQLDALMEYCRIEYPVESDRMLCVWLQRGSRFELPFRCWFLEWLLHHERIVALMNGSQDANGAHSVRRRQWQCALYVAALQEEHVALKRKLVQALHEMGPLEDEALVNTILRYERSTKSTEPKDATVSAVGDLLEFYWAHAHELAPFTLLCAVKLHTLVNESRDTTNGNHSRFLRLTDDILVRLRWAKLLKPVFFDGLLIHCFALKVFDPHVTMKTFAMHPALQQHVNGMEESKRIASLERLVNLKERLEEAFTVGAVHFHAGDSNELIQSDSGALTKDREFVQLPSTQQRLVLLDLEQDLEDAPVSLFSHILLSLSAFVSALMACFQAESRANDLLLTALKSLFTLLELRRDQESCFFVAAALFDAQVARLPIWSQVPIAFVEIVEMLVEVVTLEANRARRWIVTIALQQLLFECEAVVLQQCWSTLERILPKRLVHLSRIRLPST
ncbi:hypothetical protein FI667_g5884, partial [Globisporangium splendens]